MAVRVRAARAAVQVVGTAAAHGGAEANTAAAPDFDEMAETSNTAVAACVAAGLNCAAMAHTVVALVALPANASAQANPIDTAVLT